MNDVVFIRQQGGLARTAPGEDHISAFISYGGLDSLAGLESVVDKKIITNIFSLRQAEELGIVPNDTKFNETITDSVPDTSPDAETDAMINVAVGHGIHNLWHYHISEFFRINPTGVLWLGLFENGANDGNSNLTFEELETVQMVAEGRIRQAAIYSTGVFAETQLTNIQAVANGLEADHMPLSVLYAADISKIEDIIAEDEMGMEIQDAEGNPIVEGQRLVYDVVNQSIKEGENKNVSLVIGQDAGNLGQVLFEKNEISITSLGATLGAVSSASVHESIAWVQEFNVAGTELDQLALADGRRIDTFPRQQIQDLSDSGFIFLRKHIGISGSFFNDSHAAVDSQSDFSFIENNRTIDKAIRGLRTALLPQLSSPVYVQDDGTLSFDSIGYFESLANRPLEVMRTDGEVSNYDVFIDPNQQILSDSILRIQVSIIPVGVARTIQVSVGFTLSIA